MSAHDYWTTILSATLGRSSAAAELFPTFEATEKPATHVDDRQIYVSAAGADTGNWGAGNGRIGTPYLTIAYALNDMRDGFGDRMHLRRGDTFQGTLFPLALSGNSATRPMMFTSYGTGARPIIDTNGANFYQNSFETDINDLWFTELEITNAGATYDGTGTHYLAFKFTWACENILVEDCYIHNYGNGVVLDSHSHGAVPGRHTNMRVRGCVIADIYNTDTVGGDSQNCNGIYVANVDGLYLEHNILLYAGWTDPTYATRYKHAIYVHGGATTSDGGGSSDCHQNYNFVYGADGLTLRAGGEMKYNFCARSLSGVQTGMGDNAQVGGITVTFEDNVVTQLDTYDAAVPVIGFALGNVGAASTFKRNINCNTAATPITEDVRAMWFRSPDDLNPNYVVAAAAVDFADNIFYHAGLFEAGGFDETAYTSTITFTGNDFIMDEGPFGDWFVFNSQAMLDTTAWVGNNVWSATGTNWFYIGGARVPFSTGGADNDWIEKSGDATATSVNTAYANPTADLDDFAVSIGLANEAALVAALRTQEGTDYDSDLTATNACTFFKAAFS